MSKWKHFKTPANVIREIERQKHPERSKYYSLYLEALSEVSNATSVIPKLPKRSLLVAKLSDRPFLKPKSGTKKNIEDEMDVSLKEEHLHLPEYTKYRQYHSLLMDEEIKRQRLQGGQTRFEEAQESGTLPMLAFALQPHDLDDSVVSAYLPFVADLLPYGRKDEASALIHEALQGLIIKLTAPQKKVAETYLAKLEASASAA